MSEALLREQNRNLSLRRNVQDVRILQAERMRLRPIEPSGEDLGAVASPSRAVDDRRAVRRVESLRRFPRRKVSCLNEGGS